VRFGRFELSADTGELRKNGVRLKLSGQGIQVLSMLAANPGELVTREVLQQKLWPGASYGDPEHGLNAAVNKLRETLGDSATEPTYIETVPGRGYRFIGVVESATVSAEVTNPTRASVPDVGVEVERATGVASTWKLSRQKLLITSLLVAGALTAAAFVAVRLSWHSRQPLPPFSAKEWNLAGTQLTSYEAGTDAREAFNGHPSACLASKEPHIEGFGSLIQSFQAHNYLGKRLRFRAFVKSNDVQEWAGLWMSVSKGNLMVAFDNMHNRSIKGTTDWQEYEVVLDVPQDATRIDFGVLLAGTGRVWLNGVEFDVVGLDIPTTDEIGEKPKLGFEK